MNVGKHLLEGLKMVALFGAIALVVWSMPEYDGLHAQHGNTVSAPATTAVR